MREMARQGDVLIIPLDSRRSAPAKKTWRAVPREAGRVILQHGELTGHAHAISDPNARLFETGAGTSVRRWLEVYGDAEVRVRHEEHGDIPLAPGLYEVRRQREYDPFEPEEVKRVRYVRD